MLIIVLTNFISIKIILQVMGMNFQVDLNTATEDAEAVLYPALAWAGQMPEQPCDTSKGCYLQGPPRQLQACSFLAPPVLSLSCS